VRHHHILIVCADTRVEPQLLTGALADAAGRAPRDAINVVRVIVPAVLPPTLPISAWPPVPAARLEALRAAAGEAGGSLRPPARIEIVPCRSVPALLGASWPVDALVIVGSAGRRVRRAARGVAAALTIAPSSRPPGRARPRRPARAAVPGSG
jgi:hypothetical protein